MQKLVNFPWSNQRYAIILYIVLCQKYYLIHTIFEFFLPFVQYWEINSKADL